MKCTQCDEEVGEFDVFDPDALCCACFTVSKRDLEIGAADYPGFWVSEPPNKACSGLALACPECGARPDAGNRTDHLPQCSANR